MQTHLRLTKIVLPALMALTIIASPAFAGSAAGIDTPDSVTNLPLSVQGVTGCVLTGTSDKTVIPSLNCNGGITSGGTTIHSDGSTVIGSNATPQPASALTVNGHVGVGTGATRGTLDVENGLNTAQICLNGNCVMSLGDLLKTMFQNMYLSSSADTTGAGTKYAFCNEGDTRVSCGFYSNSKDGKSLAFTNPPEPVAPNGCGLTSPEGVDPWAVSAYCVH